MDENNKKLQREIAKDKIQVILSGIAVAVLIVMELYIMINFASNFMFMAVGILLMIVALFFLISAILDMSLKSKDMEAQKYEEIYNAQKASYLVIKKSFDEMDERLRNIEQNSSLPAEDIINAQKAVAKVTISRSKENTDALMNSNDELINQLFTIREKIESNNSQIIEKQQAMLKEANFDIQQKISQLTNQISNIEGKIQNGIPVMAQPFQMAPPVMPAMPTIEQPPMPEPSMPEPEVEMPATEEPVEDLGIDLDIPVEEEPLVEEPLVEESVEDIGIDLDMPVEEAVADESEPVEDLGIDLDMPVDEPAAEEEISLEPPVEEVAEEEISLEESAEEVVAEEVVGIEEPVEEAPAEEEISLEMPAEEPVAEEIALEAEPEEAPAEEIVLEAESEEAPTEEIVLEAEPEEVPAEEIVLEAEPEEAPAEEIVLEAEPEEAPAEEIVLESTESADGVDLDALLEEVGGPAEEEQEAAPEPEPEPPAEDKAEEIVIPDVGVDLTDPNRVMSAEEIEKLFANI